MAVPTYHAWGDAIAALLATADMSQSELARRLRDRGHPIDASRVSKWVRGIELPGDIRLFPAIEQETGARAGTIFRAVGYVEDDPGDVAAVINADPHITHVSKRVLIAAYRESLPKRPASDPRAVNNAPREAMNSDR